MYEQPHQNYDPMLGLDDVLYTAFGGFDFIGDMVNLYFTDIRTLVHGVMRIFRYYV